MLSTEEFKTFAKNYVLFGHVTTRIPDRKDDDLLGRKGGGGFPYVVGMDAEGRVLSRLSARTVEGFQTMMDEAKASLELRKQKDLPVDKQIELLTFDLEVGNVDAAAVKTAMDKMEGLTADQTKMLEGMLVDAEIRAVMKGVTSRELAAEAGKKFVEMAKAGKRPTNPRVANPFWQWQLLYAETTKNVALFESLMPEVLEMYKAHPQLDRIKQSLQAKLDGLKAEAGSGD